MANLIEAAISEANSLIHSAYEKAASEGLLPAGEALQGTASLSKGEGNGDYALNHAMASARSMKKKPGDIAGALVSCLELEGSYFSSAEIAGPGFINLHLSDKWYGGVLEAIETMGRDYGSVDEGKGEKLMVEFVSANPTGPMTIGNARGGVLGDTLACVLEKAGYDVTREFYVNDEGNQIDLFGKSIEARYLEIHMGADAPEFPENGYHGEDIRELARIIAERDGDKYMSIPPEDRRKAFTDFALPHNIEKMKAHLERYRISYDRWFCESELYASGYLDETMEFLEKAGYTYEKDGAIWLKNTELGADKDEVLRRANGFYTYYAADIAYHRNKLFVRDFQKVIDVWGADHHGHAIRFNATMTAPEMGMGDKELHFLIMQMVRLTRGGETVKVSKRTGKALTLNDLLDEIGVDACRFFFNTRPDTHLEFDLDLAIRQDSENPVYYVQYAHARICSLLELLGSEGHRPGSANAASVSLLNTEQERDLIKGLAGLPEEIRLAARDYDPSRINRYVTDLSGRFHRFYNACRIRDAEPETRIARLGLADLTRAVIAISLSIIGVSAPEKM